MKNGSRIIISNLSEDQAIALLAEFKREPLEKGAKLELDHPEPPDLFEKEYCRIEDRVRDLDTMIINDSREWGGVAKLSQVISNIKSLKRFQDKLGLGVARLGEAIQALESASQKQ
jgi:hypothetical protein